MAGGFLAPAAGVGVGGERGGVGALGGQDGQEGRFGAEVGAVLADVGVGAGSWAGVRRQYPPASRALIVGVLPVGAVAADVGDGQWCAGRQHGSEVGFGLDECAFVVGADSFVEKPPVA